MSKETQLNDSIGVDAQSADTSNSLTTSDLGLAASLMTIGYPLTKIDRTDNQRFKFLFKINPKIEKDLDNYFNGKLKVSAKEFYFNLRSIKQRIYGA